MACPANTFGHKKGTKPLSEEKVENQVSEAQHFGVETRAGTKSVEVRLYNISLYVCVCVKMLAASCVCPHVPLQKVRCTIKKKLTPEQTERTRVCCCICSWRDRTWFFFSSNSDFNPVKPSRALFCDSWPLKRSQSNCPNHQAMDRTGMEAPKHT